MSHGNHKQLGMLHLEARDKTGEKMCTNMSWIPDVQIKVCLLTTATPTAHGTIGRPEMASNRNWNWNVIRKEPQTCRWYVVADSRKDPYA